MKKAEATVADLLKHHRKLDKEQKFSFSCHSGLPCFNTCCADVNIILTPLDVLQMARRINLSTTEFLDKHTLRPITKELELPIVMLNLSADDKKCPFVSEEGCTVYGDRPWACRMYPVGMAIPPAHVGEKPNPIYFLFEDDFCEGGAGDKKWTVDQWKEDQKVVEREIIEEEFRKLVFHPYFIGGRQLDPKRMEMFYTASYDIDKFREFILQSTFLKRFELDETLIEEIKSDDKALMHFSFRWLRFALFAEPTMTVRKEAQ